MLVQNFGALRQFVPAELKHNSKGWYIEYYKLNPIVQDLERVRIMMNRERKRCKTLTEFKLQTSAIILQINKQLAAGFINLQQSIPAYGIGTQESYTCDNVCFYTPLEHVIDLYEKDRCGELKETTMRSYSFSVNNSNNGCIITVYLLLLPFSRRHRRTSTACSRISFFVNGSL